MESRLINQYVIVRTQYGDAHAGLLVDSDGEMVGLNDAYRLYAWKQLNDETGSMSGVAMFGVGAGSTIVGPVSYIELTGVVEIISCTAEAMAAIKQEAK